MQIRDAVVGALLSAVLFEAAKTGFVAYVSNANYSVIYGALATVPIFLFWLYIVWMVVLFGASLAASLTTFSEKVFVPVGGIPVNESIKKAKMRANAGLRR